MLVHVIIIQDSYLVYIESIRSLCLYFNVIGCQDHIFYAMKFAGS